MIGVTTQQAGPQLSDLPAYRDPTAHATSFGIGGPWGRHAGLPRRTWWTPVRMILAMAAFTLALGYLQKAPCADGDWVGHRQYTHMCYSDIVPLWSAERLDVGAVPYRDTAVEYPVMTGGFMWLTAELTRGVHAVEQNWSELMVFGALSCILLALCGLVVAGATAHTAGRRPYDAAIFALSPLLIFHAFSNWDLLAMSLTAGAMWAWARDKPVLAGTLLGLGAAAKLYPGLLLVPLLALAWRTRRWEETVWACSAAVGAWLAVNIPIGLAYYHGWSEFYRFSVDRPAERSTFWAIFKTMASGSIANDDAVNWKPPGSAVALALVAALLLVVWIARFAPRRPRFAQLAFLTVLAFLLTTKVWSPQYSLWLVPLLALARPRWRLALIWQGSEIAVWFLTLTLFVGQYPDSSDHGVAYGWLVLALLIRDVLLIALAGLIIRDIWHPELDDVRADGSDDPGGGVFDGMPDPEWSAPELLPVGAGGVALEFEDDGEEGDPLS
jgi:uncharacterized membrane protein